MGASCLIGAVAMDPQHVALDSQERPPSEPATTPWAWVPDPTAWVETLVEPLLSWTPALMLDSAREVCAYGRAAA